LTIEEAFGCVIRRLRKERLLSQDELSVISRLDRGFISQLERGKQQPTLLTIFGLAAALKVSSTRILNETELLLYFNKIRNLNNHLDFNTFEKLWKQLEEQSMAQLPGLTGNETILVVDDELFLREFLTKLLIMHGYKVMIAEDGREAVELYREQQSVIDMVLMDVMMPRVDGIMACKEISEINPDVKIMLMSGYSEKSLSEVDNLKFIQKPLLPRTLLSEMRRLFKCDEEV